MESDSNTEDTATESIVYSESYTESLREEAIKELYGDREQYAKDHTGSRADYVDKEASASGELVVDEERMQAVYDEKLKEFDDMVDAQKVDNLVKEKQEQLVANQAYKDDNSNQSGHTSRKVMYWKSGGKYFGMLVIVFMIIYLAVSEIKKKK